MKEKNISNHMNTATLFIVPTPIGNLRDMTLRAIDVLSAVDIIVCEDTRHTLKLLNHYGIKKPLLSSEKFSEARKAKGILDLLRQGKQVALVSDAGTPLISDPGALVVKQARQAGFPVEALPGACAFVTALSASGFSGPVRFIGFFPRTKQLIDRELMRMRMSSEITIFYESPKRIATTLSALQDALGDRMICLAREITKVHEEYCIGPTRTILERFREPGVRGEITVIVQGQEASPEIRPDKDHLLERARGLLQQGYSRKDILQILIEETGRPRNELYALLIPLD